MFGVLVIVFCPDRVSALNFSLGGRQIPFIVSLRVVRAVLFGAGGIRKKIEAAGSPANTFWQDLQVELQNGGYEPRVIHALCASLSRTGILLPMSAVSSIAYIDSLWLKELGELADLEALAEASPSGRGPSS
jgi:hypothetical protein